MPSRAMLDRLKRWAQGLKRDVVALWIGARDPRTPWYAKAVAAAVAAYALSPIDLIPDVIPIVGYIDDLLIVPAGIALAVRLIPPDLLTEFRDEARRRAARPQSRIAAVLIVVVWCAAAGAAAVWGFRTFR
jgi:uncharacterized membrane protein YkvA (DUF1232 family)